MKFTINDPKFDELVSDEMKSGTIRPTLAHFEFEEFMRRVAEDNLVRSNRAYSNVGEFLSLVYRYAEKIYGENSICSNNPYRGIIAMNLIDHYVTPNLIKMRFFVILDTISLLRPDYTLIRDYLNGLVREWFTTEGNLEKVDRKNRNRIQTGIMKLVHAVMYEYHDDLIIFSSPCSGALFRTELILGRCPICDEGCDTLANPKTMMIDYDRHFVVGISDRFNIYNVLIRDMIANSVRWSDHPLPINILMEWWNTLTKLYGRHATAEILLTLVITNHTPVPTWFIDEIADAIGGDYRALIPTPLQYYKPEPTQFMFTLLRFCEINQFDSNTVHKILTICYNYEAFDVFRHMKFDDFVKELRLNQERLTPIPDVVYNESLPAKTLFEMNIDGVTTGLIGNGPYVNNIII